MAFTKKTIRDIEVRGKKVLLRTMLNVPIQNGKVSDTRRLDAAKSTIKHLLDNKASLILISHHSTEGQSLEPVAKALSGLLDQPVIFVHESVGPEVINAVERLRPGEILMLENLRFHKEEEKNDDVFARRLASYADVYVDDDFTATHREHASIVGVPKYLPAVVGLQIENEVETISRVLDDPKRPLFAVVGGAKISTKVPIVRNLLKKVDGMFIGGAMANTFLLAQHKQVGKSLVEKDQVDNAHDILSSATHAHKKILLPLDLVVTTDIKKAVNVRTVELDGVEAEDIIADIGHQSVIGLERVLPNHGTVIWNGPMGISEERAFAEGTKGVAEAIIACGAYSLVGGGDTADYIDKAGLADKFDFVSTGGGASMELMSGNKLPGVEALLDKDT